MTDQSTDSPAPRPTFTERLRLIFKPVLDGVARALIRIGLGPNALTVIGCLIAGGSAYFAARGQYVAAALVFALGTPFDALDGPVARLSGKTSRFGALLDSTLDRYAEAFLLIGLSYHLATTGQTTGMVLAFVALFGSVMVSYVRARSEGLGIDNKVGLLTRVERVILLLLALLTGWVVIGLGLLAALTHLTVAQRVWHAYRATRGD